MKKILTVLLAVVLVLGFCVSCNAEVNSKIFGTKIDLSSALVIKNLQYSQDNGKFYATPILNERVAKIFYSIGGGEWTDWSSSVYFTAEQVDKGVSFIATRNKRGLSGDEKSNIVKATGWVLQKDVNAYKFLLKSDENFNYVLISFEKTSSPSDSNYEIQSDGLTKGSLTEAGFKDSQNNLVLAIAKDKNGSAFTSKEDAQNASSLFFKEVTDISYKTSEKKISEGKAYGYVSFSSKAAFTVSATDNWEGKLYYSVGDADYDSSWNEWDGSVVSATISGSEYKLHFRGLDNHNISDGDAWEINATNDVTCFGNIMNLLDYTAPDKTTMTDDCFSCMFEDCDKLSDAGDLELPATKLKPSCYESMFQGCTSLTKAPELPATTLVSDCYYAMFKDCTSLTQAPNLPATALVDECYRSMFEGCTNLESVSVSFTAWTADTKDWLTATNTTGTFNCPAQLPTKSPAITLSGTTVPSGWTVEKERYSITYNANGATGTVPTDANKYDYNDKVVPTTTTDLTNGELIFCGWNTKADGTGTSYVGSAEITVTSDVILYAKWLSGYAFKSPVYKTANTPTSGLKEWEDKVCTTYTNVTSADTTWGVANQETWYVATGTITISNTVTCKGTVNLILADGCELTINGNNNDAGINVTGNNKFNIFGNTGKLKANGGTWAAGIGGADYTTHDTNNTTKAQCDGKNITINGGDITANGGDFAAGIGGGRGAKLNYNSSDHGNGTNITINGGTVTAKGKNQGAGIGGGARAYGKDIVINGGTVNATANSGNDTGAGIGGGYNGYGSNITINGGAVTAQGGPSGAGIGGGCRGNGSYITIRGGNVTATGGSCGAGIGGGNRDMSSDGNGQDITITGGSITATGGSSASGIGGGASGQGVRISISQGLILKAGTSSSPTTEVESDQLSGKRYCTIAEPEVYPLPTITYRDYQGDQFITVSRTDYKVLETSSSAKTIGLSNGGWYVVSGGTKEDPIKIPGIVLKGDAHIILADNSYIEIKPTEANQAGIFTAGKKLYIYGQENGTGTLVTTGTDGSAGIGGRDQWYDEDHNDYEGSNITINGGTITASSESWGGAGIGGANWGNAFAININGGTITATGGPSGGAGIGGGFHGQGGDIATGKGIYIRGGYVFAKGGSGGGAGIGGGRDETALTGNEGVGENINISGGTVFAIGGNNGAGIGGGYVANGSHITITGGTVTAIGGDDDGGAGIGGGSGDNLTTDKNTGGYGEYITISGGTVIATGGKDGNKNGGAGIGGGSYGGGAKHISITGGNITATGGISSAFGIGRGNFQISGTSVCEDIKINQNMVIHAGTTASPAGTPVSHTSNDDLSTKNEFFKQYVTITSEN